MGHRTKPERVPDGFNYDMWLGPAPYAPYCPARCHVNFRWILDYSGGQVTDWGGHHPDIAQWGMGTEKTGPVEVKNAKGEFARDGLYNTAKSFYFECIYKNGVKLIVSTKVRGGVTFEGTEGRVWADRGRHEANPKSLLESVIGPDETHLYRSDDHARNFIDCVISREEPVAPIETAHRSITIAHVGNIAMLLGRDLKWDPNAERFIDDDQANRMLSRSMRSPWHL
jgi:predicted dehydrogenase